MHARIIVFEFVVLAVVVSKSAAEVSTAIPHKHLNLTSLL